jgi:aldehyde dehydrogenase (NAD+)
LDKAIDIGAIIAPVQLERITALVKQGKDEGADLFQPSWSCPSEGWFYPPTLLSNVSPASTVAQIEIFGPVLVAMTFRTPKEAIDLANNTVYGLAASVWSENLNLALDVASQIKAGTVWVNSTNLFDAASGFGGYRESGYGREGGKEGLYEYLRLTLDKTPQAGEPKPLSSVREVGELANREGGVKVESRSTSEKGAIDKTHKNYIGGKQVRPDGGYSLTLHLLDKTTEEVARGNRKDIRNAVESAQSALTNWSKTNGHARAQILYYLAENMQDESASLDKALARSGSNKQELEQAIERVFTYAAWADKFDGQVHSTAQKGFTYTMNEPIGVIGIVAPNESPLLGFLSLALPAIASGNTVVAIPSESAPLPIVELYRILEMSDLPAGVLNIVTGLHSEMQTNLAEHDAVDAIWHFGEPEAQAKAELLSAGNLKQCWTGLSIDWASPKAEGAHFLRHATQVKNVWVPYGE